MIRILDARPLTDLEYLEIPQSLKGFEFESMEDFIDYMNEWHIYEFSSFKNDICCGVMFLSGKGDFYTDKIMVYFEEVLPFKASRYKKYLFA